MMRSLPPVFICAVVTLLVLSTQAKEVPRVSVGGGMIHGGSVALEKAGGDTINLMAASSDPTNGPGEPYFDGDFENASGSPSWNGWTHDDLTQPNVNHWQVSNYDGFDTYPSLRAWCGDETIAACGIDDPIGGYGNSWDDLLKFSKAVGNPLASATVQIGALLQYDTEPGYDYVYLSAKYQDQDYDNLGVWDGTSFGPIVVNGSATWLPGDLIDGTNIEVYWRFRSDSGWSDEDCSFSGAGACQVDDISVTLTNDGNVDVYTEDFDGTDPFNPAHGSWVVAFPDGVGDFAKIWPGLQDIDSCLSNYSPQVAFIDDGVVVPGTGGSMCINWCYGPGGYIVTTDGGLLGANHHLNNAVISPVMEWPSSQNPGGPDNDGCLLTFSTYHHSDLQFNSVATLTMVQWGVRSADTDGSAGNGVQVITDQPWVDRYYLYYGPGEYRLDGDDVTDLLNPGRDEVQVQLVARQPSGWGWPSGPDGTPAPYFDNVTVKVFPYVGPAMSAQEIDLAQDNFPERGSIDYDDLGSHSVRFDAASNTSPPDHLRNDPGDSVVVRIVPVRAGSALDGAPKLHYLLDPNPVFSSAMRTAGLADQGFVEAMPAVGQGGQVYPDRWAFDLPDTGFLFPGDVLHYYIEATDAVGGPGGSDPRTAIMPTDTTGFSTDFWNPLGYDPAFTVHALPSIRSDGFGGYLQPDLLFINDFGTGEGMNKWYTAFHHLAFLRGEDYDVYHVNDPRSGGGNGIGGRAGPQTLAGYSDILYTCGDLDDLTISSGIFHDLYDPGDDLGTLDGWLELGGKDLFLTGDNLANDLAGAGEESLAFLQDKMGITLVTGDVRPFIGNQTSPLITPVEFNPVFLSSSSLQNWIAFGGCPSINTFDGVQVTGDAERLAEFVDIAGEPVYSYSACTLNVVHTDATPSRVISMPVDLMNVGTNRDATGHSLPARVQLLRDVTQYFGFFGSGGDPSNIEDLPGMAFTTSNAPNPFNPFTTIKYTLPQAGHLKLNIYNVRGQLVKTLIDGHRPAGADQTTVWDGKDNLGSAAASGTYFYEARAAGEVKIGKMTLLK